MVHKDDPDFDAACERAAICVIHEHQEFECAALREELKLLPECHQDLLFHEHIQRNTPVNSVMAANERMLWHQRLGHPGDHCLHNAHKHVAGVLKVKHMDGSHS